jgi:hypothetical protein
VEVFPITAVVAYNEPVFSWIELKTTALAAPKSTKPFPSPIVIESVVSDDIYPVTAVSDEIYTLDKFVLRATREFVISCCVLIVVPINELITALDIFVLLAIRPFVRSCCVLIVVPINELIIALDIFVLLAIRPFVKRILVTLIVDATRELVKKAFVLRNAGVAPEVTEDMYPIVPRPLTVD